MTSPEVPSPRPETASSEPARPETARPEPARPEPAAGGHRSREARLSAQLVQQRHVTVELQHAILPLHDEPFDLPGLRAAVRYLPASHDSRVGGDWYITAELPSGLVLIAIGDVAGHGLAAAAGMARLRGALAGLAITGAPPYQLVGWLNELVRFVDPEHSASVIAGYFDPATRMLRWAQAGHPPPVLVRGPRAWALPQPDGILLGAGDREYDVASQQLQKGDLLLLYSDGLVERRGQSIDDGLTTMCEAACGVTDPDAVIYTVLTAMGDTATDDDTCLVALQIL
jgi:serine phosphatase RsbU (regulator of sigma subunit)